VITTTGLTVGVQGKPYDTVFVANGFFMPLRYNLQGTLPTGLNWNSGNEIYGVPSQAGAFNLTMSVTDSATPPQTATKTFSLIVVPKQTVRNDNLASATQLACCGTLRASLSPYSTAAGMAEPDQDFYRITANPGDRISVDAVAIDTAVDTDTVIEILDANGARMNVCKTPQANTAFTNDCLNDDVDPGVIRNSHLDVQLPTTSGVFVVHVLDWAGRARPEMTYDLRTVKLP
jgi:hypothetical protein